MLKLRQKFDPGRPVYVEAESSKIGLISLPAGLTSAMHAGNCLLLETPLATRVAGLLADYRHYVENPESLIGHLQSLLRFHGAKQLQHWSALIRQGEFETLVAELLTLHYDPSYFRATARNYPNLGQAQRIPVTGISADAMKKLAQHPEKQAIAAC